MTVRLTVTDVSVDLGQFHALRDITFTVEPGRILGVVGPNGSGKSTLLRTIYRRLRPDRGTVRIDTDDIWRLTSRAAARRTAAILQETPSGFDYTVAEIVALGHVPHDLRRARGSSGNPAVCRALHRVNLYDARHRRFVTLSGGEKQRALFARCLVQDPELLVMDEPTNHLDIHQAFALLDLIRLPHFTVIAVLHDLNLAASACDDIVVLDAGAIQAAGAVSDVLTADLISDVFRVRATRLEHPHTGRPFFAFSTQSER